MNVVVVIADALRRDHLYDGQIDAHWMPRTAARLSDWYQFQDCSAGAPWTLPACTSILTGRGSDVHRHFSHEHQLTQPTLVEHFGSERHSAAFVNNSALAKSSGLFDGFDHHELIRPLDDVFDAAHRFLDERREDGAPYFLLLHSNLVHDYYLSSTRRHYEWSFPDRDDWFELGSRVLSGNGLSATEQETVRNMYRSCCSALDEELDRFFARLNTAETAIGFVADHGEGFDYAGARIHHGGRLHNDVLGVPLAISVPPTVSARAHAAMRQATSSMMSATDLLPTLLSLSGHSVPDDIEGRCLDQDVPARPRSTLVAEDRRYLYLASRQRLNTNPKGKNMSRRIRLQNRLRRSTVAQDFSVRCMLNDQHKLIVTEFDGRSALLQRVAGPLLRRSHNGDPVVVLDGRRWCGFELFDRTADTEERVNLLHAGTPDERLLMELADLGPHADRSSQLADLVAHHTT